MNFLLPNLVPAYPEIFLLIMVCVALLAELLVGDKLPYISYLLSQVALFGCAFITFFTFCLIENKIIFKKDKFFLISKYM